MSRVSPKDPDSEEFFEWDCEQQIKDGAGGTIASIDSFIFEEGDGMVTFLTAAAISADGYRVSRKLGGGTDGVDYAITMRFTTTAGEKLDSTMRFFCANAVS
jgi:hypothetical protein